VQTNEDLRAVTHGAQPGRQWPRRAWRALAGALLLLVCAVAPVWAALELAYFRAIPTDTSVQLEWATNREYNVAGFEILCKRVAEPESAYHAIGSRIAQGGPDQGASYSFNATAGLTYGEAYCFRLREITTDEAPGEQFDLCGYGPGVAPAPAQPAAGIGLTPTAIVVETVPGLPAAPTLVTPGILLPAATPTLTPFALPTGPFVSPLATPGIVPTAVIAPTPTLFVPGQPGSPLPTPIGAVPGAADAGLGVSGLATAGPAGILPGTPPETPTFTPSPTLPPTFTPTTFVTPTATSAPLQESPLVAIADATPEPPTDPSAGGGTAAQAPDAGAAPVTPTPVYLVVTATPTAEGMGAGAAPTFTPWPTPAATPPADGMQLANLLVPTTQNLMVMLLCLLFLSATGLGVLGLVTSVLYMRSQQARDRLPGPTYGRRRL
jgi:hypothetical protein